MSQLMQVRDWRDAVHYAATTHMQRYALVERATGQCMWASLEATETLMSCGVSSQLYAAEDVLRPELPTDFGDHYFVVVHADGVWAVDFTARQFWPDSPFPLIEPLSVYRTRFRTVGTSDDLP